MKATNTLPGLLQAVAQTRADHPAVIEAEGGGQITYGRLEALSDRLRDRLMAMGVRRGDRVGIYLRKSCDAVVAIFGILKAGAAYVPVDPSAPGSRNGYVHANCRAVVVIVESRFESTYADELAGLGAAPQRIVLDDVGAGAGIEKALDRLDAEAPAPSLGPIVPNPDDLAYILYTSGSTGRPKGVMLSHRNAMAFVDWCSRVFDFNSADVFSSHAPLHFDLSILDLYLPIRNGASVVLIGERASRDPLSLSGIISSHRITVWYSAPSILSLLGQFGKISDHDVSHLRLVLFAGEVFPIAHLHSLIRQLPRPRYFNLYGPTETNVCTFYEIPRTLEDRVTPYPIGKVCDHLEGLVVDAGGRVVPRGAEGELCIAGPNVMQGYWELPEPSAAAFLSRPDDPRRWYRTGDIVVEEQDGNLRYVGRRDRMIKRRGYRVELGEIEACLYRHQAIREVAVVGIPDDASGVRVKAHLSLSGEGRPSIIELKTFCSRHLPLYMVPDEVAFHEVLPKTSTDKIDYQALMRLS